MSLGITNSVHQTLRIAATRLSTDQFGSLIQTAGTFIDNGQIEPWKELLGGHQFASSPRVARDLAEGYRTFVGPLDPTKVDLFAQALKARIPTENMRTLDVFHDRLIPARIKSELRATAEALWNAGWKSDWIHHLFNHGSIFNRSYSQDDKGVTIEHLYKNPDTNAIFQKFRLVGRLINLELSPFEEYQLISGIIEAVPAIGESPGYGSSAPRGVAYKLENLLKAFDRLFDAKTIEVLAQTGWHFEQLFRVLIVLQNSQFLPYRSSGTGDVIQEHFLDALAWMNRLNFSPSEKADILIKLSTKGNTANILLIHFLKYTIGLHRIGIPSQEISSSLIHLLDCFTANANEHYKMLDGAMKLISDFVTFWVDGRCPPMTRADFPYAMELFTRLFSLPEAKMQTAIDLRFPCPEELSARDRLIRFEHFISLFET